MEHLIIKRDLAKAKTDILKWSAVMFVILALMILGLYL
jgi:hypothetical protein